MLRKAVRWALALGLAAGVPATAFAQDTTCRTGLFTHQESFAQAQVTSQRAGRSAPSISNGWYVIGVSCPLRTV